MNGQANFGINGFWRNIITTEHLNGRKPWQPSVRGTGLYTAIAFACLLVLGFVDNLKGPSMPLLLKEMDFSYSQGGTILFIGSFGFFLATMCAGMLADQVGRKAVLIAASLSMVVGISGFILFKSFIGISAGFLGIGMGIGGFDLGGNSIIVDLHPKAKGQYLSMLSFMGGFSAVISPIAAGYFITGFGLWQPAYLVALGLACAVAAVVILTRYPKSENHEKERLDIRTLRNQIRMPEMRWLFLLMFGFVGLEISMMSWLPAYLQDVYKMSAQKSSFFLSLYFGAGLIGRLAGSVIIHRAGYMRVMLGATIGGAACLAAGFSVGSALAIFLPLSGLFYCMVFPVTTAFMTDMHKENVSSMMGMMFSFAGLGGAIGPWLMGVVIDLAGMATGFGLIFFYGLVVLGSVLVVRRGKQTSGSDARD